MTRKIHNPVFTRILVFINVAVHFFIILFYVYPANDIYTLQEFYMKYGLVPLEFWNGSIWQPFTTLFIHSYGIFSFHLLVNMIALYSLGSAIEITIGSIPFAWLYFISGLFGSLFVVVAQPDLGVPTVGASGAIMGLLAALAIFYPNSHLLVFFFPMKARTAAILFGFGSLVLAFIDKSTQISHWGHFGGFIGGFLYTKLVLNLQIGKQQLFNIFESELETEREIRERIEEIERIRREFEEKGNLFPKRDLWNQPPIDNKNYEEDIPPKKIIFDPKTGKFYIIDN